MDLKIAVTVRLDVEEAGRLYMLAERGAPDGGQHGDSIRDRDANAKLVQDFAALLSKAEAVKLAARS